jgi:hypothetical protein
LYGVALPQGFGNNKVWFFIWFHRSCGVIVFKYLWIYCDILYSGIWFLTLWHERMEHIGEKGLRSMHNKGMVEGFPKCGLEVDLCEHCIYGKQIQVRFPSRATRANGILELIHSDMFGPVTVPSLGESLYYVSFIDDFSRKTWIYFLRKESKVFEKFKEFKSLVENQTNKKIKVLRTDNSGEFCGK